MSHDTVLHRLVRPAVRRLARTPVTPNQLTALRLATGLAAAGAFARGRGPWLDIGALCMLASLLLDRADGELARATGRTSEGGYRFDLVADGVSTMAVFIGMGVGSVATWGAASYIFGAVAAVCVLALFLIMLRLQRIDPPPKPVLFDPDDALLMAPLFVLAGLMPWVLLAAAILSPVSAVLCCGYLLLVTAGRLRPRST